MTDPLVRFLEGSLSLVEPEVRAESVDLIFTSPPYKEGDGFAPGLGYVLGRFAQRVLKPSGQLYVNFGQLKEELPRPFKFAVSVEAATRLKAPPHACLQWGQTIAWVKSIATPSWREILLERLAERKRAGASVLALSVLRDLLKGPPRMTTRGHVTTLNSARYMNYDWEPIFRYWKPPEPKLDKLAIGVPYTDKSNHKRGTRGKNGDLRDRGDAWFVPYETTGAKKKKASAKTKNAYAFPEALVEMVFKVSGLQPGAHVLDTFCGSGTVGRVARRMGFHFTGIDVDPAAIKTSRERWNTALDGVVA